VRRLEIVAIPYEGEIREGTNLADALAATGLLANGDVVCVTQKAVSKAEGRVVHAPPEELEARLDEALRAESRRILRQRGPLRIVETHHGFVCANAGIDRSNVGGDAFSLLPLDPDRSARAIRDRLRHRHGLGVAVIVTDTFGRAWREGVTDVAIGVAGIRAIVDLRGTRDWSGTELRVTEVCVADELAAAANLVVDKAAGTPFVRIRGIDASWFGESSARSIVREPARDLFR
jgi:coenzyme F420-0:L-glutamate ligase/coenzyme F420-1:gamma-L-glutamate ligase